MTDARWELFSRKQVQKERLAAALRQHPNGQWLKRPEASIAEISGWVRETLGEEPVRGLLTTITRPLCETAMPHTGHNCIQ